MADTTWLLLADAVLLLHAGIVLFVVGGLVAIIAGNALGWGWANRPLWRWAHLAAIGVVVAQAWAGRICPLTEWEMALRLKAGAPVYGGSFVAHWVQRGLYWEFPPWVFAVAYTVFAAAVVLAWWRWPPRRGA
jgi:hypothetical protein